MFKQNSRETRLGDLGESIVDKSLESSRYMLCKNTKKGAHMIEGIAFHFDKDPFIYEVKTKPYYQRYNINGTGFDTVSFHNYEKLNKFEMDVKIFFVDSSTGTIYGNTLDELKKPFTRGNHTFPKIIEGRTGEVIMFPMEHMITYRNLSADEINKLKSIK